MTGYMAQSELLEFTAFAFLFWLSLFERQMAFEGQSFFMLKESVICFLLAFGESVLLYDIHSNVCSRPCWLMMSGYFLTKLSIACEQG